jgi:hypothetical protein
MHRATADHLILSSALAAIIAAPLIWDTLDFILARSIGTTVHFESAVLI